MCFSFLSVVANTTVAEASQLLVIQALVPFSTHSSPSWRAVVEAAPASLPLPAVQNAVTTSPPGKTTRGAGLPLPGSLRAKQPTFSPVVNGVIHFRCCSSVPNFRTGPM